MRALVLAAALVGCGGATAHAPLNPATCQVWIYPPGLLPTLWTCTSGKATIPPREPCVLGEGEVGEYGVADCAQCTPAELLKLDPSAKCTPGGNEESWRYAPKDMEGPIR